MAWRPSRAVLCTSSPLCLLVSGKAYNLPGLLTGCSQTVGMMLPPMEKWVSQMVPRTREILWLFCGMAFISANVKKSWKGGHSAYHHMNSIMGRTLHLPPHELNHGGHSYHHMNSIMGRTLHLPSHELNHGEHKKLHLPSHELNHGEHTPPTTTNSITEKTLPLPPWT